MIGFKPVLRAGAHLFIWVKLFLALSMLPPNRPASAAAFSANAPVEHLLNPGGALDLHEGKSQLESK